MRPGAARDATDPRTLWPMKRVLLLPVTLAALAATALPASAVNTIAIKDDFFSPKSTTVKKGSTVTFRWAGKAPHNVVVKKGPVKFTSGNPKTSGSYKKKLTRAGTYRIVCTIHPGMEMTLRVK